MDPELARDLGVMPKKGSAAYERMEFPRHYEKLNELPRPLHYRYGAERLPLENSEAVRGFLQARWHSSVDQLETVLSAESYLQDIFFASVDRALPDRDFRIVASTAVNAVVALLRRKRQLLVVEGAAQLSTATLQQKRTARALRNAYKAEASDRLVSDPTLVAQVTKIKEEQMKAEAKAAANGSIEKPREPKEAPGPSK